MTRENGMRVLTIIALALALAACGTDEQAEREPTVGKEIADDYKRAMEEARAAEDQIMEQKHRMDEALREAEENQ